MLVKLFFINAHQIYGMLVGIQDIELVIQNYNTLVPAVVAIFCQE